MPAEPFDAVLSHARVLEAKKKLFETLESNGLDRARSAELAGGLWNDWAVAEDFAQFRALARARLMASAPTLDAFRIRAVIAAARTVFDSVVPLSVTQEAPPKPATEAKVPDPKSTRRLA
jgi:hypothetical protein